MNRPLRWMVCAAVAASTASLPAHARPTKVAMTQIADDTTGLWMAMEDALDDTALELVPTRHVTHVIEKLGLDEDLTARDVQKLAAELGVDVIVEGVFEPHTRTLRFSLFANGKRGRPFNVPANNAGSEAFRKRTHTAMMAKLAAAMRPDDRATDAGATVSTDARSTKSKKAGRSASPKDADEQGADASDSSRKTPKVKKARDVRGADDVVEVADAAATTATAVDGTKQAKTTKAKTTKAKDDEADDEADDEVVVISDTDDSPRQAKNAKPPQATTVAAAVDGAKPAKPAKATKAKDTRDTRDGKGAR